MIHPINKLSSMLGLFEKYIGYFIELIRTFKNNLDQQVFVPGNQLIYDLKCSLTHCTYSLIRLNYFYRKRYLFQSKTLSSNLVQCRP